MTNRFGRAAILVLLFLSVRSAVAAPAMLDEPSKRQTQRIEYVKHVVKEAYETSAQKDAKWTKPAGLAIDQLAVNLSNDPVGEGDEARIMYFRAGDALAAGCDDPLIHFCRAKLLTKGPERIVEVCKAADKLRESNQYGPYIRAHVLTLAASWAQTNGKLVQDPEFRPHIRENLQAAMGLVPQIVEQKDLPPELLMELMEHLGDASMSIEGDRFVLLAKANPILEKSVQPKSLALAIRGREMISYAWDARGRGNDPVAPQNWKVFEDRIDTARQLLEESWKVWPNCEAATQIIDALKAQGAPREVVDQWFDRAMQLDSCNELACLRMLEYLNPKWGGSVEDMVKFGRKMYETGNWAGGVSGMIHQVHWRAAYLGPKAQPGQPDRDYFKSPQVWNELHDYYEAKLTRRPQWTILRTYYMLAAAWSEHWDVANEQLKKLHNNPHPGVLREATAQTVKEIQAHAPKATE